MNVNSGSSQGSLTTAVVNSTFVHSHGDVLYFETDWYKAFVVSTLSVLMFLICFGNGYVIAVYFYVRKLQTKGNLMIIHLAVTDFVAGLAVPYHITTFVDTSLSENIYSCILRYSLNVFPGMASLLSLLMITVHRYKAIVHPLQHQVSNSRRFAWITGIMVWVPSFLFGFVLPFIWHKNWSFESDRDCEFSLVLTEEYISYTLVLPFFLIAMSIFSLYMGILVMVKIRNRRQVGPDNVGPSATELAQQREIKLTKTIALILIGFFLCWAPFIVILAVHSFSYAPYSTNAIVMRNAFNFLAGGNCGLNPILYAIRLPEFREPLRRIVSKGPQSRTLTN
ncbi:adenosine receptor A3-like [Lingula anatina]|uniref:Adenosine receptor A3-like n=1 Tax=Lingula anatina TaxID=7574 RepID=A0A1S3HE51_LINAN|nr:adenosine receptor A3-like [Lingula anatina]|eukprot:XP_013384352.1 adenosine receptor A3-like [Lingula anatina]